MPRPPVIGRTFWLPRTKLKGSSAPWSGAALSPKPELRRLRALRIFLREGHWVLTVRSLALSGNPALGPGLGLQRTDTLHFKTKHYDFAVPDGRNIKEIFASSLPWVLGFVLAALRYVRMPSIALWLLLPRQHTNPKPGTLRPKTLKPTGPRDSFTYGSL